MALTQVQTGMIADAAVTDAKVSAVGAGKLTGTRTLPTGVVPAGTVLQVVNVTSNTQVSTTSSSLSYSGFSATITPLYATSKILMIYSNGGAESNNFSGPQCYIRIYRDSGATLVLNLSSNAMYNTGGSLGPTGTKLDSPATTSPVTYQMWFSNSNGTSTFYMATNSSGQQFTLMEIAG